MEAVAGIEQQQQQCGYWLATPAPSSTQSVCSSGRGSPSASSDCFVAAAEQKENGCQAAPAAAVVQAQHAVAPVEEVRKVPSAWLVTKPPAAVAVPAAAAATTLCEQAVQTELQPAVAAATALGDAATTLALLELSGSDPWQCDEAWAEALDMLAPQERQQQ